MTQTNEWPPTVSILLLTYEDGERKTAHATLRAALDNITYDGRLRVHIADDGSVDGHVASLVELAAGYSHVTSVGVTNAARRGYGASFNLATQRIHESSDVVLVLEDDWILSRPLDLGPLVDTLYDAHPFIRAIRLGYLGYTQHLEGYLRPTPAGNMLVFDPESAEPHVAAGHPRLELVEYQREVGPWTEGLAPGATEFDWCRRREARFGIAWPLDYGPSQQSNASLFVHVGSHGLGEVEPEA